MSEGLARELDAAIELLMSVLYQATSEEVEGERLICHQFMSTYEHATWWLEERGYLEEAHRGAHYRIVRWREQPAEDPT